MRNVTRKYDTEHVSFLPTYEVCHKCYKAYSYYYAIYEIFREPPYVFFLNKGANTANYVYT